MSSQKTLGRLIGSNLAALTAESTTTPETGRDPYAPHHPGTKSVALGENWTSSTANRLLVALGTNIENIARLLDAPTLREDVLQYERSSSVASGVFGFPALSVPDPTAVAVANVPEVNLGADNGTNEPPFVWLFVGFLKKSLQGGSFMRFYRESDQALNGVSGGGTKAMASFSAEVLPSYVKANAAASDYHGTQNYLGTSPHAFPDSIPPIQRVAPDLPPYNGALLSNVVGSWAPDGLTINVRTWKELGARCGCFVEVQGSNFNDGIYQISDYADSKVVLTRGSLARVTVTDPGIFTAGQLVAWADPPSHATAGASLDTLNNKAYVVWKSGSELWLAHVGSSQDSGARITTEISGVLGELEAHRFGKFGQYNQEAGADDNNMLPVGTRLYPVDFTVTGSVTSAEITAYSPAGGPAVFNTNDITGGGVTATLCSPPGFLLNPVVGMASIAAVPNTVMGGNYRLQCRVMSSVRDDIMNIGSSVDDVESKYGAHLPGGTEDRQAEILNAFLGHLHHGDQIDEDYEEVLNHKFSASRRILGPNLYLVRGADTATGLVGMGTRVGADANFAPGVFLEFTHPTATGATSRSYGVVVAGWDEYVVLKDVHREWEDAWESVDYVGMKSIDVLSTCDDAAATEFTVSAVYYPKLRKSTRGAGPVYMEAPPDGVNTAYNTLLQSNEGTRGHALGRDIELISGKPVRYALPSVNNEVVNEYWSDQNIIYIGRLLDGVGSTRANIGFGKVVSAQYEILLDSDAERIVLRDESGNVGAFLYYGGPSLALADVNTGLTVGDAVPLSNTVFDDLPPDVYETDETGLGAGQLPSILGTLAAALPGGTDYSLVSNGVLKGCTITASATAFQLDVTEAFFMYRSRKMARKPATEALSTPITPSSTEYVYYDFATDSYDRSAAIDLADDSKIWLAKVTADGVGVTTIIDMRQMVHRKDATIDITVGDVSGNDYTDNVTNFRTLGEALLAIGVWNDVGAGQTRSYNIHIVAPTTEVEDAARGLSHPYNIPVDGIHIYGHKDGSSALANVTWATEKTLINLNGKDGSIQNVNFIFNPLGAPTRGATPTIGLFTVSGLLAPFIWQYDITNCDLAMGSHAPEFFFFSNDANQGQQQVLRIRDCSAVVANTGVSVDTTGANDYKELRVEHCRFSQYDNTDKATNYNVGVYTSGGGKVVLLGNEITNLFGPDDDFEEGIRIEDCGVGEVFITNNRIYETNIGINLVPNNAAVITSLRGPNVTGNTLVGTKVTGIYAGIPYTTLNGNFIDGGGTCSNAAVHLDSDGSVCNGCTITTTSGTGILVTDHTAATASYGNATNVGTRVIGNTIEDTCIISGYAIHVDNVNAQVTERLLIANNNIDMGKGGFSSSTTPVRIEQDWAGEVILSNNIINGRNAQVWNIDLLSSDTVFQNNNIGPAGTVHLRIERNRIKVRNNTWTCIGDILVDSIGSTGSPIGNDCDIVGNTLASGNITFDTGYAPTDVRVEGNKCDEILAFIDRGHLSGNTTQTGFALGDGGGTTPDEVTVTNNRVEGVGTFRVYGSFHIVQNNYVNNGNITLSGSNCLIADNIFTVGTVTMTSADNCTFRGNRCNGNLTVNGDNVIVSDNEMVSGGIAANGDHCKVINNTLGNAASNISVGAAADPTSTTYNNCIISNNYLSGGDINVWGFRCTISNNQVPGGTILLGSNKYTGAVPQVPTIGGCHTVSGNQMGSATVQPVIDVDTGGCVITGNNLCYELNSAASPVATHGVIDIATGASDFNDFNIITSNIVQSISDGRPQPNTVKANNITRP